MCWIPKSDDDLEFAPMEYKFNGNKDDEVNVSDWYSRPDVGDQIIEDSAPIRLQVKQIKDAQNTVLDWENVDSGHDNITPSWYWGQHVNKGRSQTPQLMVCYFRGLPKNQDWLRVDVVRSFEALPRNDLKDYVGVKRRKENERTLNFVKKKSLETALHNHDLDDAKVFETHVKPNIHKIPDRPDVVYAKPSDDKPSWLSRAATALGDTALDMLPVLGGMAGAYFGGPLGAIEGASAGMSMDTAGHAMMGMGKQATGQFGGTPYSGNPALGSSFKSSYATF